jgi:hypothetical protein
MATGAALKPADGPAALVGRDGWYFLCNDSNRCIDQYVGKLRLGAHELSEYSRLFEARRAFFEHEGIPFILAVLPSKEHVYSEFLPNSVAAHPPYSLLDQLLELPNQRVLDLRQCQSDAKRQGLACYRTDSHWTSLGAYFAYREIVHNISAALRSKMSAPPLEELRRKSIVFDNGDLRSKPQAVYSGGELFCADCRTEIPSETVDHFSPRNIRATRVDTPPHLRLSDSRQTHVFEISEQGGPRILVFNNSYGMWVAPFLAEHFARAAFVWYPSVQRAAVLREKPDLVLQITVDRFLRLTPEE